MRKLFAALFFTILFSTTALAEETVSVELAGLDVVEHGEVEGE